MQKKNKENKEKIVNVPNAITLLRLLMLVPVLVLVHSGRTVVALIVYLIFLSTDALDGYFARRLKQETDFGEYFDFVVDFIGYYALIIYFIAIGKIVMLNSILIAIATFALLWIAIMLSRKAGRLYMPHRTSSKVMALLLTMGIIVFIIGSGFENLFFFIVLMVIYSYTVTDYIRYTINFNKVKN